MFSIIHKCSTSLYIPTQSSSLVTLSYNLGVDEMDCQLLTRQEAHKRIIWSCSWNPFGHEFATASRDKSVKIWTIETGSSVKQLMTLPQFNSSVTALSWAGLDRLSNKGLLAVGMENGLIELWSLSVNGIGDGTLLVPRTTAALALRLDPFLCHVSTVHRLAWRNSEMGPDSRSMELASCGADHSVRVYEVKLG